MHNAIVSTMVELIKAVLLGAIQGMTEFLPISSTGHLIIAQKWLGISQEKYGLSFDAALHLGTLVALLLFFRNDWMRLINSIFKLVRKRTINDGYEKLAVLLILGTIPAMIAGLLLEDLVETVFRSTILVGLALIFFSVVFWHVEKKGKQNKEINQVSAIDSLIIGSAQAVALIPGVSRSGITIASGMWRGLNREEAARFAFLLSAPIIGGAGGLKLVKLVILIEQGKYALTEVGFFIAGIMSSFVFGYITIAFLLKYLSKHSLIPFIYYRVALGVLLLVWNFR